MAQIRWKGERVPTGEEYGKAVAMNDGKEARRQTGLGPMDHHRAKRGHKERERR